ncbi:MAG: type II secretion system GspH family protein [Erysipelothrix sp.]|nr:type II secretion system GspH family protein [Erysipelothrix sp.]
MRNRKGMTLVEVIVAMALFAIVMVTVFPAFLITNMMNNVSKEFMDANYYASAELEEIYNKAKTTSMPLTVIWMSTRGYICETEDTGERVCTKSVNNIDYEIVFDYHPQL